MRAGEIRRKGNTLKTTSLSTKEKIISIMRVDGQQAKIAPLTRSGSISTFVFLFPVVLKRSTRTTDPLQHNINY